MENRQLSKFTFYDLYGELLEQLEDDAAGRFATLICEYMLTDTSQKEAQNRTRINIYRFLLLASLTGAAKKNELN